MVGSNNQKLSDVATIVKGAGAAVWSSIGSTYYAALTVAGFKVRSAPYDKYEVFVEYFFLI